MHERSAPSSERTKLAGLTRRRLVGTAAWAAPAVAVAAAAPAFAASVPATVTTAVTTGGDNLRVRVTNTFTNAGGASTGALLASTEATPTTGTVLGFENIVATSTAGWVFVDSTPGAGGRVTFNFRNDNGIAAGATSVLRFRFNTDANTATGSVTTTPSPTNGTGTSGSATYLAAPLP